MMLNRELAFVPILMVAMLVGCQAGVTQVHSTLLLPKHERVAEIVNAEESEVPASQRVLVAADLADDGLASYYLRPEGAELCEKRALRLMGNEDGTWAYGLETESWVEVSKVPPAYRERVE